MCLCRYICPLIYVLTVLIFTIFLDDYYRSPIFSTTKQNFTWKRTFCFPRLYLQKTNILAAFARFFSGVSNGTINQIDYTMIHPEQPLRNNLEVKCFDLYETLKIGFPKDQFLTLHFTFESWPPEVLYQCKISLRNSLS